MIRQRLSLAVALVLFWLERLRDFGKPRSLQTIHGRAVMELMTNPTITKYQFVDGVEVDRRSANPFVRMTAAFEQVRVAFDKFGHQILVSMARVKHG